MTQVVAYASTPLHQLHLFLVYLDDASVAVGCAVKTYHETVTQRTHLESVAYAAHRTALRNDVAEIVK